MKTVKCAACGTVHSDIWCPKCKSVVNVPVKENQPEFSENGSFEGLKGLVKDFKIN